MWNYYFHVNYIESWILHGTIHFRHVTDFTQCIYIVKHILFKYIQNTPHKPQAYVKQVKTISNLKNNSLNQWEIVHILLDYTACIVPEYSGCTFHAVNLR